MIKAAEVQQLARAELLSSVDGLDASVRASPRDRRRALEHVRTLLGVSVIVGLPWFERAARGLERAVAVEATTQASLLEVTSRLRRHLLSSSALDDEGDPVELLDEAPSRPEATPPQGGALTVREAPFAALWAAFNEDAVMQLGALQDGLLLLEASPERVDLLEALMRAAHSLKGAARVVQLTPLLSLTHAIEDALLAVQRGQLALDAARVNVLLQAVDLCAEMVRKGGPDGGSVTADDEARGAELALRFRRPDVGPSSPSPGRTAQPELQAEDRVVRVTAEMADRLLGLAGESVVEAQRVKPTVATLIELRLKQTETLDLAQSLVGSLRLVVSDPRMGALLVELAANLAECQQLVQRSNDQLEEHARRAGEVAGRLYNDVLASRMRPLRDRTRGLPRMARDLGAALGKQVVLSMKGDGTLVDRDILERLEAPLGHLLRNAIDHGVEPPRERRAAGKREVATVAIEASQSRGRLRIEVSDDGRGIDVEAVRARALAKGLVASARASSMGRDELLEMIFLPGFSTAASVSDISGRGVGLDVVRSTLEQMGGSVKVSARRGEGTTFVLEAPLTRSVLRCLLVRIAAEVYAVPLGRVDRVLRPSKADITSIEGRDTIEVDGAFISLLPAAEVLGLEPQPYREGAGALVVNSAEGTCALLVDAFLGEEDLVVRRLDPRLKGVENIMGASTMQDGKLVLIVDVDDVLRAVDVFLTTGKSRIVAGQSERPPDKRRVLVVDDSLTVREAQRQLLASRGYEVDVAVDGVEGWNIARSAAYDLVITDIDMPRMNGIDLVRKLKADERLSTVPVLIVSYKDREEDRLAGLEAGADAYIKKSAFDDEVLLEAVHKIIGEPYR